VLQTSGKPRPAIRTVKLVANGCLVRWCESQTQAH
jgi:hypothetical protein